MQSITTIGLDIAKSVFQVHGIDAEDKVIIRRQLKRRYVLAFFQKLAKRTSPGRSTDLCLGPSPAAFQCARLSWYEPFPERLALSALKVDAESHRRLAGREPDADCLFQLCHPVDHFLEAVVAE